MDAVVTRNHRAVLNPMSSLIEDRGPDYFFKPDILEADTYGEIKLYPGMLLALSGSYLVPYSQTAAYGTDSDTAVGLLVDYKDITLKTEMVSPVTMGAAIEAYCYELGGTFGSVPAGAKTDLPHLRWK